MRWLGGITKLMDMGLSELRELVRDREAWRAEVHPPENPCEMLTDPSKPIQNGPSACKQYTAPTAHPQCGRHQPHLRPRRTLAAQQPDLGRRGAPGAAGVPASPRRSWHPEAAIRGAPEARGRTLPHVHPGARPAPKYRN